MQLKMSMFKSLFMMIQQNKRCLQTFTFLFGSYLEIQDIIETIKEQYFPTNSRMLHTQPQLLDETSQRHCNKSRQNDSKYDFFLLNSFPMPLELSLFKKYTSL